MILTVLAREIIVPPTRIPIKDCWCMGGTSQSVPQTRPNLLERGARGTCSTFLGFWPLQASGRPGRPLRTRTLKGWAPWPCKASGLNRLSGRRRPRAQNPKFRSDAFTLSVGQHIFVGTCFPEPMRQVRPETAPSAQPEFSLGCFQCPSQDKASSWRQAFAMHLGNPESMKKAMRMRRLSS